jgi:hypothetical protein
VDCGLERVRPEKLWELERGGGKQRGGRLLVSAHSTLGNAILLRAVCDGKPVRDALAREVVAKVAGGEFTTQVGLDGDDNIGCRSTAMTLPLLNVGDDRVFSIRLGLEHADVPEGSEVIGQAKPVALT